MVAESVKYESLLKANGAGSFANLEYDESGFFVLRTSEVKTTDLSGAVRLYFNAHREQVLSGRRFDPMSSNLILMRPGTFYRVQSTLEIVTPIPKGVYALPVLLSDVEDIMSITTGPLREGFVGPVCYTVQPYRKLEAEKMTSFASLMFFEDPSEDWVRSVVDSNRTKTSKVSSRKGSKLSEVDDESSIPIERDSSQE